MMAVWEYENSLYTEASRDIAWDYWSDMQNHAKEPGVKRIEFEGPFVQGAKGCTITEDFTQEWELAEVVEGRRFVILGWTPDGEGSLSFAWNFEDEGSGTRMTQRIRATGPQVEEHMDVFRQMEINAPKGMAQLANELDRLAQPKQ